MFRKFLAEKLSLTSKELDFLNSIVIPNISNDYSFCVHLPDSGRQVKTLGIFNSKKVFTIPSPWGPTMLCAVNIIDSESWGSYSTEAKDMFEVEEVLVPSYVRKWEKDPFYSEAPEFPEYEDEIPDFGDSYTIEKWLQICKDKTIIDVDGTGYPAKDGKMDHSFYIRPSCPEEIPAEATHIVWFNR